MPCGSKEGKGRKQFKWARQPTFGEGRLVMETNYKFERGCCKVVQAGGGGASSQVNESSGNCLGEEWLTGLGMLPRKRNDHKGRELFESPKVIPCGGSCFTISIAFSANLGEINAVSLGLSAQPTTAPPSLPCAPSPLSPARWVSGSHICSLQPCLPVDSRSYKGWMPARSQNNPILSRGNVEFSLRTARLPLYVNGSAMSKCGIASCHQDSGVADKISLQREMQRGRGGR